MEISCVGMVRKEDVSLFIWPRLHAAKCISREERLQISSVGMVRKRNNMFLCQVTHCECLISASATILKKF
jgi:hypothetical protein